VCGELTRRQALRRRWVDQFDDATRAYRFIHVGRGAQYGHRTHRNHQAPVKRVSPTRPPRNSLFAVCPHALTIVPVAVAVAVAVC
jgi:hypothetical protein